MSAIAPRFTEGPVTYTVAEPVTGGQLVEARASSVVGVAAAGSLAVLGVALKDATNAAAATNDATALPSTVPVAADVHVYVTYAAAANFGDKLIAAANGQVTPAGATPDARTIVGYCSNPGGVGAGAVGLAFID
ncbi:MAG TPA: hypothetical protein VFJ21_02585 [Mycobacteriales bacterium]|nr:hypothetical protein [Mycobacteriales bacterium]